MSSGPVAPTIVKGWPANSANIIPQIAPDRMHSIVPCGTKALVFNTDYRVDPW
jgi:hypothetical protein